MLGTRGNALHILNCFIFTFLWELYYYHSLTDEETKHIKLSLLAQDHTPSKWPSQDPSLSVTSRSTASLVRPPNTWLVCQCCGQDSRAILRTGSLPLTSTDKLTNVPYDECTLIHPQCLSAPVQLEVPQTPADLAGDRDMGHIPAPDHSFHAGADSVVSTSNLPLWDSRASL